MEKPELRSSVMRIGAIINSDPQDDSSSQGTDSNFHMFSKLDLCACLQENGRVYAVYRDKINLLSCDEQEQDHLNIFHELFAIIQHICGLPHAPCPTGNARFLDLGCGTGFWAIDLAKRYPNSYVLGVDIVATQPPNHPSNCEFSTPFDFERSWVKKGELWDVIHLQLGCGCVSDWPSVYRQAFDHLHPGGWFEHLEIDFEPRCDNGSLNGMALPYWYQQLKKATEKLGHPLAHSFHETVAELHKAGFAEISHYCIRLPLNPWPLGVQSRHIGCWYNLAMTQSIETLSLAPFSRAFGWPLSTIQCLAADVKSEILQTRVHSYNILHVYIVQKSN